MVLGCFGFGFGDGLFQFILFYYVKIRNEMLGVLLNEFVRLIK